MIMILMVSLKTDQSSFWVSHSTGVSGQPSTVRSPEPSAQAVSRSLYRAVMKRFKLEKFGMRIRRRPIRFLKSQVAGSSYSVKTLTHFAKYSLVEERQLGGLMFWDISKIPGDHPAWSDLLDTFGSLPETDPTDPTTTSDPSDPAEPSEEPSQDEPSTPSQGSSPVIVLTAPEAVEVGQVITLDASQSYDVDGDALSFDWSLESGSVIEWRSDTTDSVASLQLGEVGIYRIRVEVSDGQNLSTATVEIAALATPSTTSQDEGCSQGGASIWIVFLLAGLQFATRRRHTYKAARATRR